jgi:hypothetical protein
VPFNNENDGSLPQFWPAFKQRLREPERPGGNATGFQNFEPAVAEKWLMVTARDRPRGYAARASSTTDAYDKLARNFLAEAQLAAITILLN